MAGITDTITSKQLGTTVKVTFKRYGDGTIAFVEDTAGKPERRKIPGASDEAFDVALIAAIATVA